MISIIIALFACGTFFGAAIYISLAQHPASIAAGKSVGGLFFPPMYKRAAPMQIVLALVGFVSGIVAWCLTNDLCWLVGALLLISVIPITLILIMPINNQLLSPENNPESPKTKKLLRQWGYKHWIRTVVSGLAFVAYIYAAVSH